MVHAAVDREPRALRGTRNLISNPFVNGFSYFLACLSSHVAFTSITDCGAMIARHFSEYNNHIKALLFAGLSGL
jgi:hypothetical protein